MGKWKEASAGEVYSFTWLHYAVGSIAVEF